MDDGLYVVSGVPSSLGDAPPSRRLALLVEYEGTEYAGFQLQEGHPTIQGELEQALERLTGRPARVRGASRTDAGAHALGQMVDFLTDSPLPLATFPKGLNFYLPADIRIQAACEMAPEFHSRRSASGRSYRYLMLNRAWPSPVLRRTHHWVREPLDAARMDRAAQCLVGRHDFRPLAPGLPAWRSAVREVVRWSVRREGGAIVVESEGNGFLPHQIRRANGLLIEVGKGRLPEGILRDVMAGTAPGSLKWPSAPACGLCLVAVRYPNFGLQVRVRTDETDQHIFS
ncbi:MAG: tRNA pseudouridine(38-40) synthase TruA [Dehalococcoidia bacterium]|nr:tRNA pseudouridine(38-40) synthase TruA [Dehalococcoidia bacterium]MSQ17618.1 tRNA pseudouridine(38-40) synthase TruA [Dehalococcoidia bacterium]